MLKPEEYQHVIRGAARLKGSIVSIDREVAGLEQQLVILGKQRVDMVKEQSFYTGFMVEAIVEFEAANIPVEAI